MNINIFSIDTKAKTRINPGFICAHGVRFGILKIEDWFLFKTSLLR